MRSTSAPDTVFATKDAARRWAWDALQASGEASAPLPPHGRIPNFHGARDAAERLFTLPTFGDARCIKVNPDSPQKWVRRAALERGISVLVPTPGLRAGFQLLDPGRIDAKDHDAAATRATMSRFARMPRLDALPELDAIVTGCAAVTAGGGRCGKGAGYSDIEWGILMELGHGPVPVATTVHELQIMEGFPQDPNDMALSWIVTPTRIIAVTDPSPMPSGLDWSLLTAEDIEAMPILKALKP